jgi:hypothetical protein
MRAIDNYSDIQVGDIITNSLLNIDVAVTKTANLGVCYVKDNGDRSFSHFSLIDKGLKEGYLTIKRG